jgi:hypothetical protein
LLIGSLASFSITRMRVRNGRTGWSLPQSE